LVPQLGARRHCGALSIAVSGAARGTRSNFIIGEWLPVRS